MSKRRLNTLKGKRLVTGDANLMTKDEICINATPNGVEVKEIGTDGKIKELSGSSSSTTSNIKYYSFDISKNEFESTGIDILSQIVTSIKGIYYDDGEYYVILPTYIHNSTMDHAFQRVTRCKINYDVEIINYSSGIDENGNLIYIKSLYDYINMLLVLAGVSNIEEFLSKLGLTECTKEEFYDLTKE